MARGGAVAAKASPSYLQVYVIQLYRGMQNGILPAYAGIGLAAQNPLLLEAFGKLARVDEEMREENG